MKIHNNAPLGGKTARKTARSSTNGVFGQLLDAGSPTSDKQSTSDDAQADHTQPDQMQPDHLQPDHIQQNQPQNKQVQQNQSAPMQAAWHTLQESVSLLDEAMHCIEAGNNPPQQLIQDIEQLRAMLRQQVSSGSAAVELQQADTLLAVEAERIRAMQS